MNFEEILFETFKTESVEPDFLIEGVFPLNPTLAFFTLKRNALDKLKKVGSSIESGIKGQAKEIKSRGLLAKEKARASVGMTSGKGEDATVYRFTKEQTEVLSEIWEKYGDDIVEEIKTFRKEILAPYQLIKRIVKQSKTVSSRDKFGMTHAQFKSSVESGKKKIQKRSEFFGKNEELQEKLERVDKSIETLETIRDEFKKSKRLRDSLVNRVLKNYDLDEEKFGGYSLDELKRTYDELKKNAGFFKKVSSKEDGLEGDSVYSVAAALKRSSDLRSGEALRGYNKTVGKDKINSLLGLINNKLKEKKTGSFNAAFAKYMLRRDVIDELGAEGTNLYKETYLSIINGLLDQAIERRKKLTKYKTKTRGDIDFNEFERKIFKKKENVGKEYSGDQDDYIQVIKDEDFGDPEHIKRPEKLIEAEKKIEALIKKFERNLKKKLSEEDFNKLKRYRLINNLITVKELKSPEDLFKSPEEIKKTKSVSSKEEEQKDEE